MRMPSILSRARPGRREKVVISQKNQTLFLSSVALHRFLFLEEVVFYVLRSYISACCSGQPGLSFNVTLLWLGMMSLEAATGLRDNAPNIPANSAPWSFSETAPMFTVQ